MAGVARLIAPPVQDAVGDRRQIGFEPHVVAVGILQEARVESRGGEPHERAGDESRPSAMTASSRSRRAARVRGRFAVRVEPSAIRVKDAHFSHFATNFDSISLDSRISPAATRIRRIRDPANPRAPRSKIQSQHGLARGGDPCVVRRRSGCVHPRQETPPSRHPLDGGRDRARRRLRRVDARADERTGPDRFHQGLPLRRARDCQRPGDALRLHAARSATSTCRRLRCSSSPSD